MTKTVVTNLGAVGLVKDLPPHRLPANAYTDGQNVDFTVAGVQSRPMSSEVMTPVILPSGLFELTWLMQFPPSANPTWVYAGANVAGSHNKRLGVIRNTSAVWTAYDITRQSGGVDVDYTNGVDQRWQGCVFQGLGVFNQQADVPQLWNPIQYNQRLIDMPNWSTNTTDGANCRVRSLRPYKNYLISMYLSNAATGAEYPYRVRWCSPTPPGQSPSSWDVGDPATLAGEIDFAETPDYLVDGLTLGEIFIIYKEHTTWGLQEVGGQQIMRRWQILGEAGLLFRDCVSAFHGGHFVATQDDIIVHNGSAGSVTSVIQNNLRKWLTANINLSRYYNCFTFAYPSAQEIWFCFPMLGHTFANIALIWHWDTGKIGVQDLPEVPFAANGAVAVLNTGDVWG